MPGRSITFPARRSEIEVVPVFLSTVTPGKFPVRWFNPVSTLKREVFPLLGFPTKAIWTVFFTTMRFAKVACSKGNDLRDREFCVKVKENDAIKKMLFQGLTIADKLFLLSAFKQKVSC